MTNIRPARSRALALSLGLLILAPLAAAALPVAGMDTVDSLPKGAYVTEDGGLAIPLRAETPDWYTPEMHQKVLAAGLRGMAYDAERDLEIQLATQHLFIRPGAWMWSPAWCTMNFIYGTPGNFQIGSAGHCTSAGDPVVLRTTVPGSSTVFTYIGNTDASVDGGVGADWALIDIFPVWQSHVDEDVAVIMGPQGGAYTGGASLLSPVPVKHFGHGLAMGTGGTPRAGVSVAMTPSTFYMHSAAAPGDSGSAVLLGPKVGNLHGQGLGVLTHLVVFGPGLSIVAGTRLSQVPAAIANGDGDPDLL